MSWQFGTGSRLRLIGATLLVVTFLAGALAGAAFHQVLLARETAPTRVDRPDRHDHRDGRHSPWEGLGLTPEQQARIDAVLERRKRELDAFWEEHGPQMRAVYDSTRAEIQVILSPEQRAELDRRREERRARERERDEREKNQHKQGNPGQYPGAPKGKI